MILYFLGVLFDTECVVVVLLLLLLLLKCSSMLKETTTLIINVPDLSSKILPMVYVFLCTYAHGK
jgi:hypothetical protein